MKKHDSAESEPWRRSLEGGRETHHTQVGSPADLWMSPPPQKYGKPDEEAESSWDIPLQEYLRAVNFPPAQQGDSHVEEDLLWDCLQVFSRAADDADQQSGGQWAAEGMPSVSGEGPGAQRSHTSSGTEGIVEHFSILVDQFEPKVEELLKEMSFDSLFPDLSPSDSLEMEVKAKGDREGSLKAPGIALKKPDSAEPQQTPWRRSLEVRRETFHPKVGYPGKLQRSPSPRKIKRSNEDPQPTSLYKFLNSVGSPQAKQGTSQVAEVCFEGFLPSGQSAAKSMPDVNGEAPGVQRSCASSGTEDSAEHFPVLVEPSEPKVPEVLRERSLMMEVKAKEDRKAGLEDVGPVSDSEEDNLHLRRPERSSQSQASPHGEKVITLNAAEIEEAPGIQQSIEICARLDPVRRDSFIADEHLSEATSCVREMGDAECGESFRQSSDLLKIQQITRDYLCSVYGRSYSTSSGFSRHEQTHAEEKLYPCSECGKTFRTSSRLSAHKQIHTLEKKYKCPECGKSYKTSFILSKHKRTHSEEKPYKCPECGESYRTNCNLSRHKRSHSKEKPYKCRVCGKCYTRKDSLLDHLHIHRGGKTYKCSECGKRYSCYSTLSRHKRSHREENR